MYKIYIIIGKSSTGKDTIYNELVRNNSLNLKTVTTYTTRPIRKGETNGKEYNFVDVSKMEELKANGEIIEHRDYNTIHGVWSYFTANDGQIDLMKNNYIMIGTIESFCMIKDYYGAYNVVPIYIEVEDGIRLQRALDREKKQIEPKYAEMCRRYLSDTEDFSEEKLLRGGISRRFNNVDLCECIEEIVGFIEITCNE